MSVTPLPFRPLPFLCDAGHPSLTQGQWGIVCVGALLVLYLLLRSNKRKRGDPLARSPGQATLSQQRNVERQMQNLLVELSEMARQITAQLDTRTTKLALMIDDADEKAAMLQRVIDECRAVLATPPPAVAPVPPAPASTDVGFEPSLALANESDARHRQVYALADAGRSASDIAREIDRPHGEVELILALRPR
jgi:hypothetical protein